MVIASVESSIQISGQPTIAAFANGKLLEIAEPMSAPEGAGWIYYLTLQSDQDDRTVHFEVYDQDGRYVGVADEQIRWDADQRIGALNDPFVLHLQGRQLELVTAFPNPFSDIVEFQIEASEAGLVDIEIYNANGTQVYVTQQGLTRQGLHKIAWKGRSMNGDLLPSGMYTARVQSGANVSYVKLLKQ